MKKNLTELVFVIDRSGSMHGLEDDTLGGFNSVIEAHQAEEGECLVSTVLFDHETKVLHDREDIRTIAKMTRDDYAPRGSTALLDALGGAIRHIARVQRYMPDEYKAEHIIFVIITDGMENASRKYTLEQVKSKIVHEQEKHNWEFIFLGANMDAVNEAGMLGISDDHSVSFLADPKGTNVAYGAIAGATVQMRGIEGRMDGSWKCAVERDTAKRSRKHHGKKQL